MIILFQHTGRLNTLPLSSVVGRKRPPTNIECNPLLPHQHSPQFQPLSMILPDHVLSQSERKHRDLCSRGDYVGTVPMHLLQQGWMLPLLILFTAICSLLVLHLMPSCYRLLRLPSNLVKHTWFCIS
jgi:hypothetical protein